jgi:hypothetical protein
MRGEEKGKGKGLGGLNLIVFVDWKEAGGLMGMRIVRGDVRVESGE